MLSLTKEKCKAFPGKCPKMMYQFRPSAGRKLGQVNEPERFTIYDTGRTRIRVGPGKREIVQVSRRSSDASAKLGAPRTGGRFVIGLGLTSIPPNSRVGTLDLRR